MRWPTRKENHDDGFVRPANAHLGLRLQNLWQRQASHGQSADFEKIATRKAVAETRFLIAVDRQHLFIPTAETVNELTPSRMFLCRKNMLTTAIQPAT